MTRSASFDPLLKYTFMVSIAEEPNAKNEMGSENILLRAGFTNVDTPKVNIGQKSYSEGGGFMNPHNINTGASFTPISMSRGLIKPSTNYKKVAQSLVTSAENEKMEFAQFIAHLFNVYNFNNYVFKKNYRFRITITHLRRDQSVACRYILYNCTPTYFEPASDFGSTDDDSVSIETITFSYEGFEYDDDFTGEALVKELTNF